MPANRDSQGRPLRPTPRRGAGKGGRRSGGIGGSQRAAKPSARRGAAGIINPFNVAGRQQHGRSLRDQEEEPYAYDSNRRQFAVIKVILALWIILALATAIADYQERQELVKWDSSGLQKMPSDRTVDGLLQYAQEEGISCSSDPVTGVLPDQCENVFELTKHLDDAETLVFGLFAGYLFLFIALAVLISSFAYQSNRNLLTLKSEGQRFSAVSAMLWLFIPFFNFFKGNQIFQEIWKGSDPTLTHENETGESWKKSSGSGLVFLWWATFAVAILFGPRTIRWAWGSDLIDERLNLAWGLIITDVFLAVPAIFAYLAMKNIHERQEEKFEIVGPHMAVPPIKGFTLE
ncbi:MAG: DUF4328 domain-containing protein [Chloroflexi bacterium]|nr:DUF4328 domain-containing protein [Chloroflexota bacterium]